MGFTQNLFGSIAGNYGAGVRSFGKDFIPANANGDIIPLTGKDATWLGLRSRQMQYWAYIYCAPLASVIDRISECDVTGEIEVIKDDDTESISKSITAKKIMALLKKPNPIQTWRQFRSQQVAYKKIFGFCPIFPVTPIGFENDPTSCTSIWNLPPWLCQIEPGKKYFYQTSPEEIINELRINMLGQNLTLKGNQFFTIDDGLVIDEWNSYLTPLSKVAGLDWAISNILAAMEADNVLLRKKGPLGFISHDAGTKDSAIGYLPMQPDEKKELQDNLTQYGMSWDQFQYVISRQAIKWVPMSFNLKDLMTKETVKQGIEAICDRFNYDIQLLSNEKGTTFENKNSAEKSLYQNNIIPNNISDMEEYNRFFKTEENGIKIRTNYSELPVLQEDASSEGQALQAKTSALLIQYQNDVITLNQFRSLLGQDVRDGDDVYYSELKSKINVENQSEQQSAEFESEQGN